MCMNLVFPFSPHFDSSVQTPCASRFSLKRWSSRTIPFCLPPSLPFFEARESLFAEIQQENRILLSCISLTPNHSEESSAGSRTSALPAIDIKTRPIPTRFDLERPLSITMATANLASQGLKAKASHVLRKNRLLAPPLAGSG